MKNTILAVSIISALIVLMVLLMSYTKENNLDLSNSFRKDNSYQDDSYRPVPDIEFDLEIVTEKPDIWNQIAGLKATEPPVTGVPGDENIAGPVNNEQPEVTDTPESPEEQEVTEKTDSRLDVLRKLK